MVLAFNVTEKDEKIERKKERHKENQRFDYLLTGRQWIS